MAQLRNALQRGLASGFQTGANLIGKGVERRADERQFERQAELQAQRQQELALLQSFLRQQEQEQARQFTVDTKKQEGMAGLFKEAGTPGSDPLSLISRAKGFGESDPFYEGGGTQMTLPGGRSITHFAHPMGREERTPIEDLIRTRESAESRSFHQAKADRERTRQEAFEDEAGWDPTLNAEVLTGPKGQVKLKSRTPGMEATADKTVFDALSPSHIRRAGGEAGARAAADPQLVPGVDEAGNRGFFRMGPSGAAQKVEGAEPIPTGTGSGSGSGTDGNTQARMKMARELFAGYSAASDQISTGARPGQMITGFRQWAGQFLGNENSEFFSKVREPLAATIMSAISGAQGSVKEQESFSRLLSGYTTSKNVKDAVNRTVAKMIAETDSGQRQFTPADVLMEMEGAVLLGGRPTRTGAPAGVQARPTAGGNITLEELQSLAAGGQ